MSEHHLPDGSDSQELLWLRAKGGDEAQRLVAVTALGASGQRTPIAYALVWLSSLLRFIGSKLVS